MATKVNEKALVEVNELQEILFPDARELRKKREALGLSATKLGEMIGVSPSWVAAVERGKKPLYSAPYLRVMLYLKTLGLKN